MDASHIPFLQLFNGAVQYVVPRWQRRYCWDQSDIKRLVDDLLAISESNHPQAAHYGGALLTFPERLVPGVVPVHRVIDGQQRLTTISILLACIADELGPDNYCGEWNANLLRKLLENDGVGQEKRRKLRLQDRDETEYRQGLEGKPSGPGAVTQAWRIARRLVRQNEVAGLLDGISRFRVVSIALGHQDDPQQIFESLNATGRPLTESEKVKNWLLMGLEDDVQQELHDHYWLPMERNLGAEQSSVPIDTFLRDVLRGRTGESLGVQWVHEELRRWAVRNGKDQDRPALCRDLARMSKLYGILTGTAGEHRDKKAEAALRHLRAMGIDTHRPFTLRLLDNAAQDVHPEAKDALATVLEGVATWITRLWLANRPAKGLNTQAARFAYLAGPEQDEDYAEYWLNRIRQLRNTSIGVPGDEEVGEGIRRRKAYGGSATRSTFAVLCALMEKQHPGEAPSRNRLTVEHVMPQKLTEEWKRDLGEDAEEVHGFYRDLMGNLTLSGDIPNFGMGTDRFDLKSKVYIESAIGMTRRIARENKWGKEAIEQRAEYLTEEALKLWPWEDNRAVASVSTSVPTASQDQLRWRIGDGPWHEEAFAVHMLLNMTAALLNLDPKNAERLSGQAISSNLHPATRYPPGTKAGRLTMRAVPGYEEYVLHPYGNWRETTDRCRKMGERCGVTVQVEGYDNRTPQRFWRFLKNQTGGLPGQHDEWRGENQYADPSNAKGEYIGIYIGHERISIYIRSGYRKTSPQRTTRMHECSRMIHEAMSDQIIYGGDADRNARGGRSVYIRKKWERDNEEEWPEAAQWIMDQTQRVQALLSDPSDE